MADGRPGSPADTPRVALAAAGAAVGIDEDLPPLCAALAERGARADVCVWDDPGVPWDGYDLVVVRSVWDYARRRDRFLEWADAVASVTRLANPAAVLRWSTDKRYLAVLAGQGIPVVPTMFLAPGQDADLEPVAGQAIVVKPTVSAGSLDTASYAAEDHDAAAAHVGRLHADGRTAMVQPYLTAVDVDGEAGLVFVNGRFSHAITKGAMLRPGARMVGGLFLEERISRRTPSSAERELADQVLDAVPWAAAGELLYARVDLIGSPDGPLLLELELAEPSVFLAEGAEADAAGRLAEAIIDRCRPTPGNA